MFTDGPIYRCEGHDLGLHVFLELDGMLVPSGRASKLLTTHLITG